MAQFGARFTRWATRPTPWMRATWVVMPFLLAFGMAEKRGIAVGLVAGLIYGGLGLGCALNIRRVMSWSAAHPVLTAQSSSH